MISVTRQRAAGTAEQRQQAGHVTGRPDGALFRSALWRRESQPLLPVCPICCSPSSFIRFMNGYMGKLSAAGALANWIAPSAVHHRSRNCFIVSPTLNHCTLLCLATPVLFLCRVYKAPSRHFLTLQHCFRLSLSCQICPLQRLTRWPSGVRRCHVSGTLSTSWILCVAHI